MEEEGLINNKRYEGIIKVSSIKGKIKMDMEKIREQISRENENIIKQKVNQEIALCDLKAKLKQEKCSLDKLQHNIIEMQMQYETISGKYQDEIRLRDDILDKVNKNGKICEVLEEYEKVLGNTLTRCETYKATLCKAYHDASEKVRHLSVKYQQDQDKDRQSITALKNKVTLAGEQEQRLLHLFDNEQSNNSNLQTDIRELHQQLNKQAAEANNILMQQDMEIRKTKDALRNQAMILNTVSDQKLSVEKKINDLIEKNNHLLDDISELKQQLQKNSIVIENKEGDITALLENKQCLLKEINDKEILIASHEQNINVLKNEVNQMEIEQNIILSDLKKVIEEMNTKYEEVIGGLDISIQDLNKKVEQLELRISNLRVSSENKEKELMGIIDERDKEIDLKASANTELISELQIITEVKESLENKLKELEITTQEREKDIESKATCITDLTTELNKEVCTRSMLENKRDQLKKEKDDAFDQLKKLQNELRDQEEIWSKKFITAVNTARTEKENLQIQQQKLQNKLEDIRKNLEQFPAFKPLQFDLDDNAVLPPTPVRFQANESSMNLNLDGGESKFGVLLHEDSLDSVELHRRAFAITRRENVSPVLGVSALKRRNEATAKHSRDKVLLKGQPLKRKYLKNKTNFTNASKA